MTRLTPPLAALTAYWRNWRTLTKPTSRGDYWWLLPWWLLFEIGSYLAVGNRILPQLTLRALLLFPSATLAARRYLDCGMPAWLGLSQTVFHYSMWWIAFAAASGDVADGWYLALVGGFLASALAKFVICLLPTATTSSRTRSVAITAYRTQHKLSEAELKLFAQTMGTAKTQIQLVEAAARKTRRIQTVLADTGGLHAAQELFRELMAHPREMTVYDEFLYQKLPALVKACEHIQAVNAGNVQTHAVNAARDTMYAGLRQIAEAIAADYEGVVQEDAEEITEGVHHG